MNEPSNPPPVKDSEEARQGETGKDLRFIALISTGAAVILLGALALVFML